MDAHLLKPHHGPAYSFSLRYDEFPYFYNHWHYHKELELIHIHEGHGTQFMGDQIGRFKENDMILVGSNLTHLWRCDAPFFEKNTSLKAKATVIHFLPNCMGNDLFQKPESNAINEVYRMAGFGLYIDGETRINIESIMQKMFTQTNLQRMIGLLQIIDLIFHSKETRPISTLDVQQFNPVNETDRLNKIYQYVLTHFSEEIDVATVANLINISPKAFSRFFKARTRKTFVEFVQEIRIQHACGLLAKQEQSIKEICYECGFNNFSNFNRHFKKWMQQTPIEYKKQFRG